MGTAGGGDYFGPLTKTSTPFFSGLPFWGGITGSILGEGECEYPTPQNVNHVSNLRPLASVNILGFSTPGKQRTRPPQWGMRGVDG